MILEDIKNLLDTARKEKADNLPFLSALYSEVKNVGKNKGNRETTDEEAVKVLKKLRQGNEELIRLAGDREEILKKAEAENSIIDSFLPKQLSDRDLEDAIRFIILHEKLDSPKGIGVVMKSLQKKYAGQYDGKKASVLAKSLLG